MVPPAPPSLSSQLPGWPLPVSMSPEGLQETLRDLQVGLARLLSNYFFHPGSQPTMFYVCPVRVASLRLPVLKGSCI